MTSSDVTWIEISLHSIIIDHLILNHVKKIKLTSESIIFMVYYWYGLFSQYINLIHLRLFFSDRIPLKNPFLVQSLIEDIALFIYLFSDHFYFVLISYWIIKNNTLNATLNWFVVHKKYSCSHRFLLKKSLIAIKWFSTVRIHKYIDMAKLLVNLN